MIPRSSRTVAHNIVKVDGITGATRREQRPKLRSVRRVGVGSEAVLASASYAQDRDEELMATPAPPGPSIKLTPRPRLVNALADVDQHHSSLLPEPPDLRRTLHHLPSHSLTHSHLLDMVKTHRLSDRTLVLLVRQVGLPTAAQEWHRVARALAVVPLDTMHREEKTWLEAFALDVCARSEDRVKFSIQPEFGRAQLTLVFHIAVLLGAPTSILILRALVQHRIIDSTMVPRLLSPDEIVHTTLTRAAEALEISLPVLPTEILTRVDVQNLAPQQDTPPERVQQWMAAAAHWSEYELLSRVWRQTRITPHSGDAAVGLLHYLVDARRKGAARLFAADVLESPGATLQMGYRARFIGMCAEQSFAKSARKGWERYFGGRPPEGDGLGTMVPWMTLRLVSLFLSLAKSVPDARFFADRVARILRKPLQSDEHRALGARTLFLLADHTGDAKRASELRRRGMALIRASLDAHRVPTPIAPNVLVHELAQHSMPNALRGLRRMRRHDVGPDGVALGSVLMATARDPRNPVPQGGLGGVLGARRLEGVRMLTDIGRRGVLRAFADHGGKEQDIADAVRSLRDPALLRWWRARERIKG